MALADENEDLIRYGLPEDVWFHVSDFSSAHVYLRLKPDQKLEDVPEGTIDECAQLVKANSIEGHKLKQVDVMYTRWRNLKKTSAMEVGEVSFHDKKKVKHLKVEKNNSIVNRINKTKEELFPDLAALQEQRALVFRAKQKAEKRSAQETEKQMRREREEAAKLRSYSSVMTEENMKSNKEVEASADDTRAKIFEDDFM